MWFLASLLTKLLPSFSFIGPVFTVLASAAAWVWQNIFWPGAQSIAKGVFSGLPSILTFGTIVGGLYWYGDKVYDAKVYELAQCQQIVEKANKARPVKVLTPIEKVLKSFDILP